jgi:hypothetical protein
VANAHHSAPSRQTEPTHLAGGLDHVQGGLAELGEGALESMLHRAGSRPSPRRSGGSFEELARAITSRINARPVTSVGIALGVGMVFGMLFGGRRD